MDRAQSNDMRARLSQPGLLMAPGVYDALSACVVEQAGFEAAFVSGSAMSYSQLGRPDIGLLTLTELALAIDRIRDRVALELIVDVDSGYGNAFHVQRAVRTLERAGAGVLQIEDQMHTKDPAQVTTRPVDSQATMVGKIRAALDARANERTLISARSDAAYTLGPGAALERATAYMEAGADILFIEGLTEQRDLMQLAEIAAGRTPLLYNVVDPASISPTELEVLGFSVAIYPAAIIAGMANAGLRSARALFAGEPIAQACGGEPVTPVAEIVGAPEQVAAGRGYAEDAA